MAIIVKCDNCGDELRNSADSMGAPPQTVATLSLRFEKGEQSIAPIHMDLCARCAKKYLAVLKEPI